MRRTKPRRRYGRIILFIGGLFIVGLLFLGGPNGLFRILSLRREKRILEENKITLEAKIEVLKHQRYKLLHDPDYIRRLAQERFKIKKTNE